MQAASSAALPVAAAFPHLAMLCLVFAPRWLQRYCTSPNLPVNGGVMLRVINLCWRVVSNVSLVDDVLQGRQFLHTRDM